MNRGRWAIGGLGAVAAVLIATAAAWACVAGPAVNLSTVSAKPSQEIQVSGTNFQKPEPVTVRWNALDGPVVATLPAPASGTVSGAFTVPAGAEPGSHVLIVTQSNAEGALTQTPVRVLLTVTGEAGAHPVGGASVPARTADDGVLRVPSGDDSLGALSLVLVGLGVAGAGSFVAGAAAVFAGRPLPRAQPVRAGN